MTQSNETTRNTQPLKRGDQGPEVTVLQQRLKLRGYNVSIDGDFGPGTERAVMDLQLTNFLVVDGIAGPKTLALLQGWDTSQLLSHRDLEEAAIALDVELAAVRAVNQVESRGSGFLDDGRPVILYERHVMRRRLKHHGLDAQQLATTYPKLIDRKPGGYQGGAAEHYRLNLAISIDQTSALESCSWGLFQIMGYHAQTLGYDSVDRFVELMHESERCQLDAFVRFIKADPALHQALKDCDWAQFARRYNGPGYKKNRYDEKLADAYARYLEWEDAA
ncbi:N-acetylmuramidase domain-containing protein [Motiliproteus sp.]|uniref:N-acetylmuramidase domain-containing protein n=1 Tax=Motiliproteus sp. TaxID=1898955 RepID=UPI003BAAF2CA